MNLEEYIEQLSSHPNATGSAADGTTRARAGKRIRTGGDRLAARLIPPASTVVPADSVQRGLMGRLHQA